MAESDSDEITFDFDAAMKSLAEEAAIRAPHLSEPEIVAPLASPAKVAKPDTLTPIVAKLLRPIALKLEDLSKSGIEHRHLLEQLAAFDRLFETQRLQIEDLRQEIRTLKDDEGPRVNQAMFSALHEELREVKDSFLFDSLQKPLILEMITLYDTIVLMASQTNAIREALRIPIGEEGLTETGLDHLPDNIDNLGAMILEFLSRYDVEVAPALLEKLNKRQQRVVKIEPTNDPDFDQTVIRELRPAFLKGERVLRPADVIIYRHQPGPSLSPDPSLSVGS